MTLKVQKLTFFKGGGGSYFHFWGSGDNFCGGWQGCHIFCVGWGGLEGWLGGR